MIKEKIINDQAETLTTLKNENERNAGHITRLRNEIGIKTVEIERYKCDCAAHSQALQKAQQEAAQIANEFDVAAMKTSQSITRVKKMSIELESQNMQKQILLQEIAVGNSSTV